MIRFKGGQSCEGQRRYSGFVVVLGLLLLTRRCEGQSQVIGPAQPIITMTGVDIILPCHLQPAVNAVPLAVEWSRQDLIPRFVHIRRGGHDLLIEQNPTFEGRTSLLMNKLKNGDVSLELSRVKLSDAGTYRCFIPGINRDAFVRLVVGSVSTQDVGVSKFSGEVSLDCKSKGWYPEPEVSWLDSEGKNLSAVRTEKLKGPDGLYAVSSRLTVKERHSESFTCRVQQKINQKEIHIHVGAELFMVQCSSAVRISICIAVCLMAIVGVALLLWKYGPNKETQKHQEAETKIRGRSSVNSLLMENEGDGEKPMTVSEKIRLLDKTRAKLDEQLEKNEGDMEHVAVMITTLTGQKEALQKQRQKIISLLQDDKVQMEEERKKLATTPKTSTHKMQKRKKMKDDLEKRKEEHDDLLENTEKLLKMTDAMIIKMTERRGRLENEKEKIQKQLKDVERQREETLRENEKQPGRDEGQMKLNPELPEEEKP